MPIFTRLIFILFNVSAVKSMKNHENRADFFVSVVISSPGTIQGQTPLYRKLYHLPLGEALSLAERKARAGYAVLLGYWGDEETFFQPLGWELLK